ncbi:MAG: hypothetical protein H0W86_12255, partial [Armatimonadetes bacterium]|nr:hypothetical protein [Armatimonadota bacterium]
CTDVLSEGVNMQEAECILNYDIHWNPVRLIQRIGRVDRRLDPEKNPVPHTISILNFLPPPDIDNIIKLVNTVEGRRSIINRTLGLDQAFFTASDPDGTLKEFNATVDGESTSTDKVQTRYVEQIAEPDPDTLAMLEHMPDGAFGVWEGAPVNGVFALFEMKAGPKLSVERAEHFKAVIGKPMLALESSGCISMDAAENLETLSSTIKGERSAMPGDFEGLKVALNRMKSLVLNSFREIDLPKHIEPKLICWLEMRA